MTNANLVLFYVSNALASADFYAAVLGRSPVESSPTFVMFKLNEATMLGLWGRGGVEPRPEAQPGASEIAFLKADKEEVDRTLVKWKEMKVNIIQPPLQMDFGYTFTASDPDGHRLRVYERGSATD